MNVLKNLSRPTVFPKRCEIVVRQDGIHLSGQLVDELGPGPTTFCFSLGVTMVGDSEVY